MHPSAAARCPRRWTWTPLARLLDLAEDAAKAEPATASAAKRLHAMVETLYSTGLRVSELVSLPETAARPDRQYILIKGKGGKETHGTAFGQIQGGNRCLDQGAQLDPAFGDSPWLFPARSEAGHIARQVFARELKSLGARAAFRPQKLSPTTCCACICEPPVAQWCGFACCAGTAGSCGHIHDANLHPCARRKAAKTCGRPSSAGQSQNECLKRGFSPFNFAIEFHDTRL